MKGKKRQETAVRLPKPPMKDRMRKFGKMCVRQRMLILLAVVPVTMVFIFSYIPLYGITVAFKDYNPKLGILGSPWEDPWYKYFQQFFKSKNAWPIIFRTLRIGALSLLFQFPAPIIFAMLLNELRDGLFKRGVQTISYVPHFISVVVICSMLNGFGSLNGLFNDIRSVLGLARVNMNDGTKYFLLEYIGSAVWQGVGWGSIIYLSALSNVDTTLYDVANIDGANRWQKMRHVAWPTIMPTTTVLLIMNAGNVLSTDYTKILLMQNSTNTAQLETIQTLVYSQGIGRAQFEYGTAVNLLLSVCSFIIVFGTNMVTRKLNPENSLW